MPGILRRLERNRSRVIARADASQRYACVLRESSRRKDPREVSAIYYMPALPLFIIQFAVRKNATIAQKNTALARGNSAANSRPKVSAFLDENGDLNGAHLPP